MSVQVDIAGSVSTQPSTSSGSFPTTLRTINLTTRRTHDREVGGIVAVTGTDGAPQALQLGSIAMVRFLALRVTGGEVRLRITTPDGATQVIPVTGLFVIDNPTTGSEITAVSLAATGAGIEVEYLAAGGAT